MAAGLNVPPQRPALQHADGLAEPSRELVRAIAGQSWSDDFYLAGSAALALYLGHRRVRDLDFMGVNRLTSPDRRDLLQELLRLDDGVRVETARDGFLYVRFPNQVALRLYYYPYPLIDPEERCEGVAVASLLDLGLMKLGAITSRGSRRDYADIALTCRLLPLATLLERSPEKFGHVRDFPLQALKGLAEVAAAGEEPLPTYDPPLTWPDVLRFLEEQVRPLARREVGLEGTTP